MIETRVEGRNGMKERKILRGEDYKFTPSVEKKAEREKKNWRVLRGGQNETHF